MMKISNGALIVSKGTKSNGMYILDGYIVTAQASIMSQTLYDKTKLWHLRLGHVSEKGLVKLGKQNLLNGDILDKLDFCDHCILGKSLKVKFETSMYVSSRPFEYVHLNLWDLSRLMEGVSIFSP
uniref:GAG-pre-integrase domain-containing protein n=1 Tax=Cajanus cajan TaxID=3821 RepID=A0A151S342_CAJCA|nr:hypothetical protein KK1_029061 [Cajanus cajan]